VQPLPNVLWIGGPPRSGKTTIARRIARRHGLRWYNADAHTWEHRNRALAAGNAAALRWEAMTSEERRVRATPAEQLELSLHAERGPMVVDDLRRLPRSPLTIAEGSPVSPEIVSAGIAARSHAVWLIPTAELQRARLSEAGWSVELPVLLATTIERDAKEHRAPILAVDGSRGVDEMVAVVEEAFSVALAEGPCAQTAAERRALLRNANDAVVSQCLAYLARPWTTGDAESMVRRFVCECDDPECDTAVELAVTAFRHAADAGPVIAAH
jgi:hypothetical protein